MTEEQRLEVPLAVLRETFAEFRRCGRGSWECQVLWVGPWATVDRVTSVVHPVHRASGDGFELDTEWLHTFWKDLVSSKNGIRAQVHTHPRRAFHSAVDDAYPIIHSPGFLSLVIPNFAVGPENLADAYLAELTPDGRWQQVSVRNRLVIQ